VPTRKPATPAIGRAQPPRPDAPAGARAHVAGERPLRGALSVPIDQVVPDPEQPRRDRDPERLADLVASVKDDGILEPLVVREVGYLNDGRTQYMVIAGGRRYAAAQQAGLTHLPVWVRESEGATTRVLQLIENIHREDLTPLDEGQALAEILTLTEQDMSNLATTIHRSVTYVSDRVLLAKHADVADALRRKAISASTAVEIAREDDPERRRSLLADARVGRLSKQDVQHARQRQRRASAPSTPPLLAPLPAEHSPVREATPAGTAQVPVHSPEVEAAITALPGWEYTAGAPVARGEQAEGLATPLPSVPADSAPQSTVIVPRPRPAVPAGDELTNLVIAAGGPAVALRLLGYATRHDLSLAALAQAIQRLDGGA